MSMTASGSVVSPVLVFCVATTVPSRVRHGSSRTTWLTAMRFAYPVVVIGLNGTPASLNSSMSCPVNSVVTFAASELSWSWACGRIVSRRSNSPLRRPPVRLVVTSVPSIMTPSRPSG